MSKKVRFGSKPAPLPAATLEHWVTGQSAAAPPAEPTKRLTLDIPATLHAQLKSHCALTDTTIADKIRRLIEQELARKG